MNMIQGPQPPGQNKISTAVLEHGVQSGSGWLLAIGGLTLVNAIGILIGLPIRFGLGAFVPRIFAEITPDASSQLKAAAFVINLIVAAIYGALGFGAKKEQLWAFIVGFVLWLLDCGVLLLLVIPSGVVQHFIISIIVHLLAIMGIWNGLMANKQLNAVRAAQARAAYYAQQQGQPNYYQPVGNDPTNPNLPR